MHLLVHALDQRIRSAEFLEGRRAAPEVLGRGGRRSTGAKPLITSPHRLNGKQW
jgi:4'-phosphopantetheinyl transferase EntD